LLASCHSLNLATTPTSKRARAGAHRSTGAQQGLNTSSRFRLKRRWRDYDQSVKEGFQLDAARTRHLLVEVAGIAAALASASAAIAAAGRLGVSHSSPLYLLAVVAVGIRWGTIPAIATSVGAFLAFDFLFVEPLYTFTIRNPDEWLNLLLLLAVAVVIGRLVAIQAEHSHEAAQRAAEAQALFSVTRALAETRTVEEAAPVVLERLAAATAMDRIWFGLGDDPAAERNIADTARGRPLPVASWLVVLQRPPGEAHPRWTRTHMAAAVRRRGSHPVVYRVRVEASGEGLGSIWGLRARTEAEPDNAETRILSAAADQLGQAVVRDRGTAERTSAEIARRSEAVKTALLDSVSHDLRTPLATIRAAAGSMLDESIDWSQEDKRAAFQAIDSEAERMGRLIRNLLDLSRIEGGALKPELEPCDLEDVVRPVVKRGRAACDKHIDLDLPDSLPPVLADHIYLSQVAANLLENAIRHGGSAIRIRGMARDGGVELTVEDDGPGVPDAALPHLFDKFYQAGPAGDDKRRGMGIGMTVVSGLTRAMGGTVTARRSPLGGLRVDVRLRAAPTLDPSEPMT
jgi:two-component system, OmpR family, sensor histidine kinase KdpD